MKKKALITGVTGQDGSYLAEFLLEKGYRVFGLVRRSSSPNYERIGHILDRIELIQGDLLDQNSLIEAIQCAKPDEVYNLGAQSFVPTSWNQPVLQAGTGPTWPNSSSKKVIRYLDLFGEAAPQITRE